MIKHIVMWKIKDSFNMSSKQDIARKIKHELEALKGSIPEIREIEVGVNILASHSSFDLVLTSVFNTIDDMMVYQNHPEHKEVASFIKQVSLDRVVVDYEI